MTLSFAYGIPVKRLQQEIDSEHFCELIAYHNHCEPIGGAWQQTGTICALVANALSDKGDYKPGDFVPIDNRQEKLKDMQATIKSFATQHNEAHKRGS